MSDAGCVYAANVHSAVASFYNLFVASLYNLFAYEATWPINRSHLSSLGLVYGLFKASIRNVCCQFTAACPLSRVLCRYDTQELEKVLPTAWYIISVFEFRQRYDNTRLDKKQQLQTLEQFLMEVAATKSKHHINVESSHFVIDFSALICFNKQPLIFGCISFYIHFTFLFVFKFC